VQKWRTDRDAVWDAGSGWSRERVLVEGAHWHNLDNTTEPSVYGGDAALCRATLTTCCYILIYFNVFLSVFTSGMSAA